MTTPTPTSIPPAFAEAFAKALPKDGRSNTLVVGEWHKDSEHLAFLQWHLAELKDTYGIRTIGLETSPFFNVFLWAYADGTLEKELGSKEAAQNYVKAVFQAFSDPDYKDNSIATANFSIAAIDAGITTVAYDSRDLLAEKKVAWSPDINAFLYHLAESAGESTPNEHLQAIRQAPQSFINKHPHHEFSWILGEVDWLLGLKPAYQTKLNAMEALIAAGHEKIAVGTLTSDGVSAVLFDALAEKTGNRLVIGGAAHSNGIGIHDNRFQQHHPEQNHGTFATHLQHLSPSAIAAEGRMAQVTASAIATTAVGQEIDTFAQYYFSHHSTRAIAGHRVTLMNLNNGKVSEMWQPDQTHERVVPLADKFPVPYGAAAADLPAIHAAHLNPLLIPEIRTAAEKVRAAMHGNNVLHKYLGPLVATKVEQSVE
jgi:hypothetical protein